MYFTKLMKGKVGEMAIQLFGSHSRAKCIAMIEM